MARQETARQWFIRGDGIDRNVISADIQRYLGNDATVRPGIGTGDSQGVQGYWIKAYRNLTSAMIEDLKADSLRWQQERHNRHGMLSPAASDTSGSTVPDYVLDAYVDSRTYNESNAARVQRREQERNSPIHAHDPSMPRSADVRMDGRQVDPRSRPPVDAMQIDPPLVNAPRGQQYQQQQNYFPGEPRGQQYPADQRNFQPQGRGQGFPQDQVMSGYANPDQYGRIAAPEPYNQNQRYPPGYQQPNDAPPPGYIRQGDYYVPISTGGYGQPGVPAPVGPGGPDYGGFGQQPSQPGRSHQQVPLDSRGGQGYNQPSYADDPRYAYPSPATTVASVGARDVTSPQQQSSAYVTSQGGYDTYGGSNRLPNPAPQYPPAGNYQPSSRGQDNYASRERDRQPPPTERERDANRRRRNNV